MNIPRSNSMRITWLAVGLALFAALTYILIASNVLGVGDPRVARDAAIIYVAAGCYILGGLLILLRKRELLVFGAVINALVMFFFFAAYQNRPAVVFSPGGLFSKIAQILLEIALVYLIFARKAGIEASMIGDSN